MALSGEGGRQLQRRFDVPQEEDDRTAGASDRRWPAPTSFGIQQAHDAGVNRFNALHDPGLAGGLEHLVLRPVLVFGPLVSSSVVHGPVGRAMQLKGCRYALWKNPEDLTERQAAKLAWIARHNSRLYRAYLLKEHLRLVFGRRKLRAALLFPALPLPGMPDGLEQRHSSPSAARVEA